MRDCDNPFAPTAPDVDPEKFVNDLVQYIADQRITMEVWLLCCVSARMALVHLLYSRSRRGRTVA